MNKERRENLLAAVDVLDEAINVLVEVRDEEQEAFDNLSEGLQYSRTGESMMQAIDEIDAIEAEIEGTKERIMKLAKPKKAK